MDEWSLLSPPLRLRKHFGICGRKKEKVVCKCHLGRDTAIRVLHSQKMQLPIRSCMTYQQEGVDEGWAHGSPPSGLNYWLLKHSRRGESLL